jgi:uncharacterized protein YjbI with pentapeptide repeats
VNQSANTLAADRQCAPGATQRRRPASRDGEEPGAASALGLRGRAGSAIMRGLADATRTMRLNPARIAIALAALLAAGSARDPSLGLRALSQALAEASPGHPADFSHRDLSYLDLSGLDFKQANLAGANLFGADLSDADLSGAMLAGADLDHTVIIRTNFTGADLAKASLFGAVAYSTLEVRDSEAPTFAGADLSGARIVARLGRANLRGAKLADVRMGADGRELRTNLLNDLSGCDLTGADLSRADLRAVRLAFAHLAQADLAGANLSRADLWHADLTGADLTNTDLTGATIEGAILTNAQGLDRAKGMAGAGGAAPGAR